MPRYYSDLAVAFLERYQFISRNSFPRVPIDALSLLDVALHSNTVVVMFYCAQPRHLLHHQAAEHFDIDLQNFTEGINPIVLAPLLFAFLTYYMDESYDLSFIRHELRNFLKGTPYTLCTGGSPRLSYSSPALLLLRLTEALLECNHMGGLELQPLPWVRSVSTQSNSWYWRLVQSPRSIRSLVKKVRAVRLGNIRSNDAEAIVIGGDGHPPTTGSKRWRPSPLAMNSLDVVADPLARTGTCARNRLLSCGIFPLPYEVQSAILEWIAPRHLSLVQSVCAVWRRLVRRSAVMSRGLVASRLVTRAFVRFLREDWGEACVRSVDLSTLRRAALHRETFARAEAELFSLRQSESPGFAAVLRKAQAVGCTKWTALEGLWEAVAVETKIAPFAALGGARFLSLEDVINDETKEGQERWDWCDRRIWEQMPTKTLIEAVRHRSGILRSDLVE